MERNIPKRLPPHISYALGKSTCTNNGHPKPKSSKDIRNTMNGNYTHETSQTRHTLGPSLYKLFARRGNPSAPHGPSEPEKTSLTTRMDTAPRKPPKHTENNRRHHSKTRSPTTLTPTRTARNGNLSASPTDTRSLRKPITH